MKNGDEVSFVLKLNDRNGEYNAGEVRVIRAASSGGDESKIPHTTTQVPPSHGASQGQSKRAETTNALLSKMKAMQEAKMKAEEFGTQASAEASAEAIASEPTPSPAKTKGSSWSDLVRGGKGDDNLFSLASSDILASLSGMLFSFLAGSICTWAALRFRRSVAMKHREPLLATH